MHSTPHAMNIFVRAVETNSFVGAARSLLIDPAAVSRAIKALETELGVLLFARSTRALKLTAEGARFHRDCVQILKKLEQATQQFRADRAMPHGRLKVGMGLGMSRRLLLNTTPLFQKQYPDIEIILLSIDEVAQIGDKGVDVLLRPRSLPQRGGQHPEPQGLVVRKLVRVLPDWECTGATPLVAIYRKTRPMPLQLSAFVGYLSEAFRHHNLPPRW